MYGSKKKMMGGGMTPMKPSGMDKKLVGGQVKMDKNKNGKLDSQDFKMMREMKPGGMVNPNMRSMADVAKEAMMKAKNGREIPRGY